MDGPRGLWTEHMTPDGRVFYYNAALSKSSWTMPTVTSSTNLAQPGVRGYQSTEARHHAAGLANDGSFLAQVQDMREGNGGTATSPSEGLTRSAEDKAQRGPGRDVRLEGAAALRTGANHFPPRECVAGAVSQPSPRSTHEAADDSTSASKDPAQALKEKLAALAQQTKPKSAGVGAGTKRFKRSNGNGEKPGEGGAKSEYLSMVQKLKAVGPDGGAGGKWLVR